jgi:hypothetical protein
MVPNECKEHYNLMKYYSTLYTLKLVKRSNDSWFRKFERIRNIQDCIFFQRDLPIFVPFGKKLKSELIKYNIPMVNNHIEINNKNKENIMIK